MAMIKCPECGGSVSDKAPACIHCGTPINISKKVKIKIPTFATGMMGNKASEAAILCGPQTVWTGYSGQVAAFDLEVASFNIDILIKHAYTGHPAPFFRDFTIKGVVEQGKNYEIKKTRQSLAFGDPTRSDWVISEVDVIDSGL